MSADLRALAEALAGLGRLTCTVTPSEPRSGHGPTYGRLYIKTSVPRPANVGGGAVSWTLAGHPIGEDEVDSFNAVLREIADLLPERARVAAAARNAFNERDEMRRQRDAAERRLRRVLHGGRARGRLLVRVYADGSAWLLDPDKRERGFGFGWPSLTELWRAHPDLRPVKWGADGEGPFLLVEPTALEAAPARGVEVTRVG